MNKEYIEQAIYERTQEFVPQCVYEAILELIAIEREACANLCKEMYLSGDMDTGLAEEAIRARGQA